MPTLRRRQTSRRPDGCDPDMRFLLETGSTHRTGLSWWTIRQITRQQFDEAWGGHGDAITAEWIAKHPGTRPFGWWINVHQQERPLVDGERRCVEAKFAHTFGFFHCEAGFNRHAAQEPQTVYLRRHGLLTRDELKALEEPCQR